MAAPPRLHQTPPVPGGSGSGGSRRAKLSPRSHVASRAGRFLKTWPATPVLLSPHGARVRGVGRRTRVRNCCFLAKGSSRGRPAIRPEGFWVLGFRYWL